MPGDVMGGPAKDHTVYVVHCTDTEGPLYESLEATFERLVAMFDLNLPPSRETLAKLQRAELDLGGMEDEVARVLHPDLINYNDTWDKVDAMLTNVMSESFRSALPDSAGNGWVYNWFCVDHVGYTVNPRRKDCGYHNIFDHYKNILRETGASDGFHFHFHPTHPSGWSHRSTAYYLHDLKIFQILARRIIDRGWFPSVIRAGFQVERPDSHWLMEQWIPFDISNMSSEKGNSDQLDYQKGESADWRRAPTDWVVYHPDHDDYQVPGNCRRYIARCLNLGTRLVLLDEPEMRKAFLRARNEGATIVSFADHDFRDMGKNVEECQRLLRKVSSDFPDVSFRYSEAREAFHRAVFGSYQPPSSNILNLRMESDPGRNLRRLVVESSEPTFGPQPFLAIRTKAGTYYHDTLDFQETFRKWTYIFQNDTFPWDEVDCVGLGTNDRQGFSHVVRLKNDGNMEPEYL